MMKRIFACLVLCTLFLSVFCTSALAKGAEEGEFSYYIDEEAGVAKIAAYIGESEHVVVPSHTLEGYPVVGIGAASFSIRTFIKTITLPDTITYIEAHAFSSCDSLTSINIPDGITTIEAETFWGCDLLSSIDLPDSVTSIGEEAFYATGLVTIDFPKNITSIGDRAFAYCDELTDIHFPNTLTHYGEDVLFYSRNLVHVTLPDCFSAPEDSAHDFIGCEKLETCVLPANFERLPDSFFGSCSSLKSITLPETITSIGNSAFSGCSSLTEIRIPEAVTSIDKYAFKNCTGLTEITVPEAVKTIGDSAFTGCTALESIVFEGSVDSFGSLVLSGDTALKSVVLPEGMTDMDRAMFKGYPALESVVVPSTASISSNAFAECPSLTDVTLREGISYIGEYAFAYCPILTDITLPKSLETLDTGAFCGAALTSVVIPGASGKTAIGSSAFFRCKDLTSVTIEEGVVSIGSSAFGGFEVYDDSPSEAPLIKSITLPTTLTALGSAAFENCPALETVQIQSGIAIPDRAFLKCGALKTVESPHITAIGEYAFDNCGALTSVDVPDGVPEIGSYAFRNCVSLTSIDLPDSVASLGDYSFYQCSNLEVFDFPASLTTIGAYACYGCNKFDFLLLPDSLTTLGEYALAVNDGLTHHVWVPASVTEIGRNAIMGYELFCYSGTTASGIYNGNTRYVDKPKVFDAPQGEIEMYPGETKQLDLWYFPPKPYYECTWEVSQPEVATVDSDHLITALSRGYTNASLRCPSVYLGVNVPIRVLQPIEDFLLEPDILFFDYERMLEDPEYFRYVRMVDWTPVDADDRELTWTTADPAVASVSPEGISCMVSPAGRGETTVTATTRQGVSRSCRVVVDYAYIIECDPRPVYMTPGETKQLHVTIYDHEGNPADVSYTLSSNTPDTLTITPDGMMTAHEKGYVEILITLANGQTAYVFGEIGNTIQDITIGGLGGTSNPTGASRNPLCVPTGMSFMLKTVVTPPTADDPTCYYEINNPEILTEENGVLTALAPGKTRVTLISNANPDLTYRLYIQVMDMEVMQLPAGLKEIAAEAFLNTAAEYVILPASLESAGSRAFSGAENLRMLRIDSATFRPDMFEANAQLVIACQSGSAAESYAETMDIPYVYFVE